MTTAIDTWMDAHFAGRTFTGPAKAYFEMPGPEAAPNQHYLTRGTYKAYGLCCEGGPETYPDLEKVMLASLCTWRDQLQTGSPNTWAILQLFWRQRPELHTEMRTELDDVWMTKELWEAAGRPTTPTFCGHDPLTGHIHFIKRAYEQSTLYLRFTTLPEVSPLPDYFKPEGKAFQEIFL